MAAVSERPRCLSGPERAKFLAIRQRIADVRQSHGEGVKQGQVARFNLKQYVEETEFLLKIIGRHLLGPEADASEESAEPAGE